ncbi:hypothetical protein [Thermonema rossianum]|uniref:hypothetical protein n=1 Tax=Thermonema rossianum TaxID=55505 RepID=UPI00146FAC64|nr:hypothetical protein [Thermonema rossianum]
MANQAGKPHRRNYSGEACFIAGNMASSANQPFERISYATFAKSQFRIFSYAFASFEANRQKFAL